MTQKKLNRVLIIEDDLKNVLLTIDQVGNMGISKEIYIAYDGYEGITKIAGLCNDDLSSPCDCVDLILLDINMPLMDGFEVVDLLKAIGQHRLIESSIVALISPDRPCDKEKILNLGVKQYIEKPLTKDKLLPLLKPRQAKKDVQSSSKC